VTGGTQQAARAADSKPVQMLGRVGLAGYGVVNLLLAWLAVQVAFGASENEAEAGKGGALQRIAEEPWGKGLLWVIGISLFALALWQLSEAIWGRKAHGGAIKKVAHVAEALAFGVLGFSAVRIAAGNSKGGSNEQQAGFTAKVLDAPGGPILVVVVGLVVLGAAGYLMVKGIKKKFLKDLDLATASPTTRRTTERLGQAGYTAVGVGYAIVGVLIILAAIKHDPDKATGLDTALATLAQQPYGTILLVIVAIGLAAYGVYCFLDARFRKP
jgi:Domain of Unknown Function (DUF1206)